MGATELFDKLSIGSDPTSLQVPQPLPQRLGSARVAGYLKGLQDLLQKLSGMHQQLDFLLSKYGGHSMYKVSIPA